MSIKEEYTKLIKLLDQSLDPEKFKLEDVLQEAVVFFDELRRVYPTAPKEERDEIMQMMQELHGRLQDVSQKVIEATGMSEEQVAEYSENPSNFSPEDWQLMQKTRGELYQSARKFSEALETDKKTQPPEPEGKKPVKRPIRSSAKRARRSRWTKS